MSQIVTRKGPKGEDKEKRQTDSPVKEMKKKIAANAEKEKQAAEKNTDKSALNEKKVEKSIEKPSEKSAEKKDKHDKSLDKSVEKKDKTEKTEKKESDKKENNVEKAADKKDKTTDKKDKPADKKEKPTDKKEATVDKAAADKENEKVEKEETTEDRPKVNDTPKAKENGALNGDQNGGDTVSSDDERESDEMFPELAYDDSDGDFEPPTPEGPSRSLTRRSQVKVTRTPETPRPASEKNLDKDYMPEDSKLLKLKDDTPSSDRKLRSSDSPKPQDKKIDKVHDKKTDSPKKDLKSVEEESVNEDGEKICEVVIEVENEEGRVKADTNYSRSRVKVSPYRRSRLADHTDTSLLANYTGNNTTMEMDITESFSEESPASPYLSGLRSIRARRSYRPLKEMALRNISANRSGLSSGGAEQPSRPTGTVVGRKRRPDADVELAVEAAVEAVAQRSKRPRLLERLARPFRVATALPARRNAEIVGINTDLPLTAPVATNDTFDPEAIKPTPTEPTVATEALPTLAPTPTITVTGTDRDSKRCAIM